jgi:dynein heavy chain, axonemal
MVGLRLVSVQLVLQENRRIRSKVPPVLEPLMVLHFDRIDRVIEPGITTLNWTSVTLSSYIDDIYQAFAAFELLIDRANNIIEYRINAALQDMSSTILCELPINEPWTVDEFIDKTTVSVTARFSHKQHDYFKIYVCSHDDPAHILRSPIV